MQIFNVGFIVFVLHYLQFASSSTYEFRQSLFYGANKYSD